jgi:hypothetical protein
MIFLLMILKDNSLSKGVHWGRPGEPDGVRLTRSLKVARSFAEDQEIPGGVLELDQSRLAQRYRIVPYRDTDSQGEYWSDEAEEAVIASSISPLSSYLTGLYVTHDAISGMLDNAGDNDYFMQEYPGWFETPEEITDLVIQLSRHPLRKDMDTFMSQSGPR